LQNYGVINFVPFFWATLYICQNTRLISFIVMTFKQLLLPLWKLFLFTARCHHCKQTVTDVGKLVDVLLQLVQ